MERPKGIIYRPNDEVATENGDGLQLPKVADSSTERYRPDASRSVKYELDPIHLAAHRDYQKWVNLPEPYREKYGVVGDPLSHFFRLHENKAKSASNQPNQSANPIDRDSSTSD